MSDFVFNIPQRDEIGFSIDDEGFIVLSQNDPLGEAPQVIRIHHLDADWVITGLKAAVESVKIESK